MIIQSKKVWFADQFVEAQIEVKDGKIVDIYEYGTHPVDCDYGDNRILPGFIDDCKRNDGNPQFSERRGLSCHDPLLSVYGH